MKLNYFGKLSMFILAVIIQAPILGIILCVAIGHILDSRWQIITNYFENKHQYQKTTEKMLFVLAYYCNFLLLDNQKAAKVLQKETISKNHKNSQDLFLYYANEFIPNKFKKANFFDKKMSQAMLSVKNNKPDSINNCIMFFNLIETIFNNQKQNPTFAEIEKLKEVAKIFNIDYIRTQKVDYEYKQPENKKYTYNNEETPYEDKVEEKSNYISQEVKDSLQNLGFNYKNLPLIDDVKKAYKSKVIKCHPDILKGQNASDNNIKKAELELTKLNKSVDIVKKFLANQ